MARKLEVLTDDHLRCRGGYNHAWSDCPPPADKLDIQYRRGTSGWRLWLRCLRCGAERLDIVNRSTGALEGRRYWLPEGYSLPEHLRKLRRESYRLELGKRLASLRDTKDAR